MSGMTIPAEMPVVSDIIRRMDALGVRRQRMTVDSRTVVAGDVFVAMAGSKLDGRDFVQTALQKGASAVLRESPTDGSTASMDPRVVDVPMLPALLGDIADLFYDHPSNKLDVFGVTGTNGKTSIVNWLAQALAILGTPCGTIGTLGVSLNGQSWPTQNTTPDAASVHTILRDLKHAAASAVAMEVSSHALELHRVTGVTFDTAIFTNLTQDHLDFHGTMEAYGEAKAKLFTDYPVHHRVINADDSLGQSLLRRGMTNTISYGLSEGDVSGEVINTTARGMSLRLRYDGESAIVDTNLIGRFNAYNLLAVAATLVARGTGLSKAAAILSGLQAAPGRMQRVGDASAPDQPTVYVDYAHTPDALAKALDAVRETKPHSLSLVFGCGGDRDRRKRPIMGAIAAAGADQVFVTSDNPRSESPQAIIDDIIAGLGVEKRPAVHVNVDRRMAIREAIVRAGDGYAVLIAGKGHEDYQEIAGNRQPFSDVQEARDALAARVSAVKTTTGDVHVVR